MCMLIVNIYYTFRHSELTKEGAEEREPMQSPVAVVTGATRGIGRAIAYRLSQEGFSCILVGSTRASIENAGFPNWLQFKMPEQQHRAMAIDLSSWPDWVSTPKFYSIDYTGTGATGVVGEHGLFEKGPYALLVNCAGITQEKLSVRTTPQEMQCIFNVNFFSAVSMCNMFIKQCMKQHTHQFNVSPCIVNVSSVLALEANAVNGTTIYSASKSALAQYTHVLEQESAARLGIRTHTVYPGLVASTDMVQRLANRELETTITPRNTADEIAAQVWHAYRTGAPE